MPRRTTTFHSNPGLRRAACPGSLPVMANRITTWKPDTCRCELHYAWDDELPEPKRVHVLAGASVLCPLHEPLGGDLDTVFDAVVRLNRAKNAACGCLEKVTGQPPGWAVDELGIVTLDTAGLTAEQLAELPAQIKAELSAIEQREGDRYDKPTTKGDADAKADSELKDRIKLG